MLRFFSEERVKDEMRDVLSVCTRLNSNVIRIVLEYSINIYQLMTYGYDIKDDQNQLESIKGKEFKGSAEIEQIAVNVIVKGHVDVFMWLVHKKYIDLNNIISLNGNNISYLSLAILLFQNGIAFFILDHPELTVDNIEHCGVLSQDAPLIKLPEEKGIGLSCGNPLFNAVYCGQVEMVRCMLAKGATKVIPFAGEKIDLTFITNLFYESAYTSYISKNGLTTHRAEMARLLLSLQDKTNVTEPPLMDWKLTCGNYWDYYKNVYRIIEDFPYGMIAINVQIFMRLRNIFRSGGDSGFDKTRDISLIDNGIFMTEGRYDTIFNERDIIIHMYGNRKHQVRSKIEWVKSDHVPRRKAIIEATTKCHRISDFFRLAQNQIDVFDLHKRPDEQHKVTPIDHQILSERYSSPSKLKHKRITDTYYGQMKNILSSLSVFCRQHNIGMDMIEIEHKSTEVERRCAIM